MRSADEPRHMVQTKEGSEMSDLENQTLGFGHRITGQLDPAAMEAWNRTDAAIKETNERIQFGPLATPPIQRPRLPWRTKWYWRFVNAWGALRGEQDD